MEKLLIEYKRLKSQIEGELGCEETPNQVMWNDGIVIAMEELLKGVDPDITQKIRLGYL